ncbi:MAG: hypothetical protein ACREPP_05195 [Rhodanobacteraceae bacterium]
MNNRSALRGIVIASMAYAMVACTQGASASGGNGAGTSAASATGAAADTQGWIANGATACDKYLTPDFVGQIFKSSAGHSKKLGAQGCQFEAPDFASISITLAAGGLAVFDAHQKYLDNPTPLPGVGDKAVRFNKTSIEAVKGANRMCGIDVMPPFGNKLSGEALAQKLGEVCNKLFALP